GLGWTGRSGRCRRRSGSSDRAWTHGRSGRSAGRTRGRGGPGPVPRRVSPPARPGPRAGQRNVGEEAGPPVTGPRPQGGSNATAFTLGRADIPDRAPGTPPAGRRRAAPRPPGPAGRPARRRPARGARPPGRRLVVDPGERRAPARPGAALAPAGRGPGGRAARSRRGRPDQPPNPRGGPQLGAAGGTLPWLPPGPGRAGAPPAGGFG